MNRVVMLKAVNVLLAVSFAVQAATVVVMETMHIRPVFKLHALNGFLLLLLAAVHVVLNWAWIKSSFFRKAASSNGAVSAVPVADKN